MHPPNFLPRQARIAHHPGRCGIIDAAQRTGKTKAMTQADKYSSNPGGVAHLLRLIDRMVA